MSSAAEAIERIKSVIAKPRASDFYGLGFEQEFISACNPEAIGLLLQSHAALLDLIDAAVADLNLNWDEDALRTRQMILRRLAAIQSATQSTKESTNG